VRARALAVLDRLGDVLERASVPIVVELRWLVRARAAFVRGRRGVARACLRRAQRAAASKGSFVEGWALLLAAEARVRVVDGDQRVRARAILERCEVRVFDERLARADANVDDELVADEDAGARGADAGGGARGGGASLALGVVAVVTLGIVAWRRRL
jgi:hypothetical protein